jgi:hypothetical protein
MFNPTSAVAMQHLQQCNLRSSQCIHTSSASRSRLKAVVKEVVFFFFGIMAVRIQLL